MSALRQTLAIALLLVFTLGTPGYAMQPGGMSGQTMTAAVDDAMLADCDSCTAKMAISACASPCLAVAILPSHVMLLASETETLPNPPQRTSRGASAAPDPFPPKSIA